MSVPVELLGEGTRAVEAFIRFDLHMNFLDVLLYVRFLGKRSFTAGDRALVGPFSRVRSHMVEELRDAVIDALAKSRIFAHVEVEKAG